MLSNQSDALRRRIAIPVCAMASALSLSACGDVCGLPTNGWSPADGRSQSAWACTMPSDAADLVGIRLGTSLPSSSDVVWAEPVFVGGHENAMGAARGLLTVQASVCLAEDVEDADGGCAAPLVEARSEAGAAGVELALAEDDFLPSLCEVDAEDGSGCFVHTVVRIATLDEADEEVDAIRKNQWVFVGNAAKTVEAPPPLLQLAVVTGSSGSVLLDALVAMPDLSFDTDLSYGEGVSADYAVFFDGGRVDRSPRWEQVYRPTNVAVRSFALSDVERGGPPISLLLAVDQRFRMDVDLRTPTFQRYLLTWPKDDEPTLTPVE